MFRRTVFLIAFGLACSVASAQVLNERMLVSTDWLANNLDSVTVIEVGDVFTFGSGHITGARLVPFAQLVTTRDGIPNELPPVAQLEKVFTAAGIGDGRRIVLYSRDPLYTTRAFFTLDYLGQGGRIAILDGLYAKWQKEALPTTKDIASFEKVPFHAQLNLNALATMDAVRQTKAAVLIDTRESEQFDGAVAGGDVKRAGHIPGAVNVEVAENYVRGAIPMFKSEAELRALYAKAGVTKTSMNIAYCRTGMQATVTYFVLRYLGYGVQLYDGSFVEWSNAKDTPVA